MQMTPSFRQVFSTRTATVLVLLLAIAGRIAQVYFFADPGGDKPFQVLATQNLLDGNGITTLQVFGEDISRTQLVPLVKWPPGYSILLAPFFALSGEQALWGTLLLDIFSAVLLLLVSRQVLHLLRAERWQINLFTLTAGFFFYAFISASTSDLQGALFFETELYLALRFIVSARKPWWLALLITLTAFAGGFTRYMLLPAGFVVPLYFIVAGKQSRDRRLFQWGFIIFVFLILLNAGFLFWQQSVSGAATYVIPSEKGFFPVNTARLYPFVIAAFANPELLSIQLSRLTGAGYATSLWILIILNWVTVCFLCYIFLNRVWKHRIRFDSINDHFLYISAGKTMALLLLLFYLSASQAMIEMNELQRWTFVQEGRYFFIPVLFLQQLLFSSRPPGGLWKKLTAAVLVLLLVFTLHGFVFTLKHTGHHYHRQQTATMLYFKNRLAALQAENPGKQLVVTGHEQSYMLYAGLWYRLPYLEDYTLVNRAGLTTTKPVVLVVCIRDKFAHLYKEFLARPDTKLMGRVNDYHFYSLDVSP